MDTWKSSVWKAFDENEVTHSVTHYLFAISSLNKQNGYARSVDIAKKLDITPGSCSTAIKWLLKKELIHEDENRMIQLSDKAERIVKKISKTRKLFQKFFESELWVSSDLSTKNACKIEHLIDAEISNALEKYLEKYK